MKLEYREIEDGLRLIKLDGVMDLGGVSSIEMDFVRYCQGENARVIVDLSKVSYLSSIGLPLIMNTAKSLAKRGGKLILLSPRPGVQDVLETTGVNLVVPICKNITAAKAAAL